MRSVHLTNNEFNVLSSAFLQKVLLRSDTFLKSSPTEVAKFQQFLEKFQPFDCVIDGLNVAYGAGVKKSPVAYAKLVRFKRGDLRSLKNILIFKIRITF